MDAIFRNEGCAMDYTPDAALTGGEVIQLADGRAAVACSDASASVLGAVATKGVFRITKNTSTVLLQGAEAWWDHSANEIVHRKNNDRDFYLGFVVADTTAAQTYADVMLNERVNYVVDLNRDAAISVTVGTAAAGGLGYPVRLGGAHILELTATNEAQKTDLLSVEGFAPGANPIVEGSFRILSDGSNATQDFVIGVASGTHASDADSIAESAFIKINGNSTTINAECDDGTNETAETTTATTYTEGSTLACRVDFVIDMRDLSSLKFYVNGARVASGTTFSIAAATGPLFLLSHLEKSSGTDVYKVAVDKLRARLSQM